MKFSLQNEIEMPPENACVREEISGFRRLTISASVHFAEV